MAMKRPLSELANRAHNRSKMISLTMWEESTRSHYEDNRPPSAIWWERKCIQRDRFKRLAKRSMEQFLLNAGFKSRTIKGIE